MNVTGEKKISRTTVCRSLFRLTCKKLQKKYSSNMLSSFLAVSRHGSRYLSPARSRLSSACCRLCHGPSSAAGDIASTSQISDDQSFDSLQLSDKLKTRLKEQGFRSMFEIQSKTLPISLSGRDLLGRAETGSGKTLCFAVPIVHALSKSPHLDGPRAMAILPTRELCQQVAKCVASLAPDLKVAMCFGGEDRDNQRPKLKGADVVVGTPGRLNDFYNSKDLRVDMIKFLVLDEADELLRATFIEQIEDLLRFMPISRQTMMFSATMPHSAKSLAQRFLHEPVHVDLTSSMKRVPSLVKHYAMPVEEGREVACIMHLMEKFSCTQVLVFVASKRAAWRLGDYLSEKCHVACSSLHGGMDQLARLTALNKFKSGEINVLVCTDVAARGLDIPDLQLVVQVGASPNGVEFYIHRSGRTGRAGRAGTSVILCYMFDGPFIQELGKHVEITSLPPPKLKTGEERKHQWEGMVRGLELGPKEVSSQHMARKHSYSFRPEVKHGGQRRPESAMKKPVRRKK